MANPELLKHAYFQNERACTLLIEELEEIWKPIMESDDWSSFHAKIDQIRSFRGIYQLTETI